MPHSLSRPQFLRLVQGIPGQGRRAALVIGFDGGSALLNHSKAKELLNELVGPVPALRPYLITTAWETLDHVGRTALLRKHTLGEPNLTTISYLAEMLRNHYLGAVIACDPNHLLLDHLRACDVALDSFDCSEGRPKVLHLLGATMRNGGDERAVFIDTSDLFLASVESGCRGLDGIERRDMKDAAKAFSDTFDLSFFWGWCDDNVNASDVWRAARGPSYALGTYSDCRSLSQAGGIIVVQDPSDPAFASTEILDWLGRELFGPPPQQPSPILLPPGVPSAPAREAPAPRDLEEALAGRKLAGGMREQPAFRVLPPCLLWPDDEVERVRENGLRAAIAFFGVDGSQVRLRLADRVLAKQRRLGHTSVYRVCGDFTSLQELLDLLRATSSPYCGIVATLPGPSESQAPPLDAVRYAIDRFLREREALKKRLFVFAPISWIRVLQAEKLSPQDLHCESLLPVNCATVSYLQRWLGTLPVLAAWRLRTDAQEADEEIRSLAKRILSLYDERSAEWGWTGWEGTKLDFFHQALDFWYDNVCAMQAEEEEPQTLASCDTAWTELLQRVERVDASRDFDLGIISRRLKEDAPPDGAGEPREDFPLSPHKKPPGGKE